jgi:GH15 family glucan-1,4-alpha-glucosidase
MPAIQILVCLNKVPNANIAVIKADLDFVAGNWRNQMGCDLWEEVRGTHFYTRLVQYRALVDGATFAAGLGDLNGAFIYSKEAAIMVLVLVATSLIKRLPHSTNSGILQGTILLR